MFIKFFYSVFAVVLAMLLLSSCVAGVSGAVAVSAYSVAKDKSSLQSYKDMKIFLTAKDKLFSSDYRSLAYSVDIKVHNNAIYMVGRVRDDNARMYMIEELSKIEGVKKIYDEIIVDSKTSGFRSFFIGVKDFFITAKTKIRLAFAPNIRSVNYSVETFDGVVYIIGNATNIMEAEKLSLVASKGLGVKKVVNYSSISK